MNTIDTDYYYNNILKLPVKESYRKDELLTRDFLMEKENDIEIYYCAHNEYVNLNAKIFIVSITPGFQQMEKSIVTVRKCLEKHMPIEEIPYICKREVRLYGTLRKNIVNMLDELELNKAFNIESCIELFKDKDYLIHTTPLIPYAVFVNGRNYNGHSPQMSQNKLLSKYIKEYFYPQIKLFNKALIIPLGKGVEEIIFRLIDSGQIEEKQCLTGFPHPSGANGHRITQFEKNKENMKKKIKFFI